MSGQKIWSGVVAGLKSQISASMYRAWFGGSHVVGFRRDGAKNILVVGVRNNFIKEQIQSRYLSIISKSLREKGFGDTDVVFEIPSKAQADDRVQSAPLFSGVAPTYLATFRKVENLNPAHTFENFVVGSSNNLAYLAASQAMVGLGKTYNPLFIYGPVGVGKTHLLQACGNEVLTKYVEARVLYVSAEKFTNDYIESLRNRSTPAFRTKYRGVDLLLVDDVHFLSGKESTQEEFFYTFNDLVLAGRQVALAADRHPSELVRIQERLGSRFLGGMTVDIGRPDWELRIGILRAKCKEQGMELDDEIIAYIAQVCQSSARELEGVLVQVLSIVKLAGRPSLDEVKSAVELHRERLRPQPTPGKIIEAVAKNFKVAVGDLCGPRRKASLVRARQILIYLLRVELGLPLESVGALVGGRDHSTVLYSVEKVEREVLASQVWKDQLARIRQTF